MFAQSSLASVEEKLVTAEHDASQLRSNLRQYETLVDEYRGQVRVSATTAPMCVNTLVPVIYIGAKA